jgi:hypothetical protein
MTARRLASLRRSLAPSTTAGVEQSASESSATNHSGEDALPEEARAAST